MYNDLINNEIVVLVSMRSGSIWECTGLLCDIDENSLKLKNVEINLTNTVGKGKALYKKNINEVILNKNYIIACYKK